MTKLNLYSTIISSHKLIPRKQVCFLLYMELPERVDCVGTEERPVWMTEGKRGKVEWGEPRKKWQAHRVQTMKRMSRT